MLSHPVAQLTSNQQPQEFSQSRTLLTDQVICGVRFLAQELARTYPSAMLPQKDLVHEMSRHSTPLQNMDQTNAQHPGSMANQSNDLTSLPSSSAIETAVQNTAGRSERSALGPTRRARSATMMELGPYPTKAHSCPIPSCGRTFKRLEHLKR